MATDPNDNISRINGTLEDLLDWDGTLGIQETMDIPALPGGRPAMSLTLQALSTQQMDGIRQASTVTTTNRTTGTVSKDSDNPLFTSLVVMNGIVSPDLTDPRLQERFNKDKPEVKSNVVRQLFLPGEMSKMFDRIYELSGFDIDEKEVQRASDLDL